MIFGRVSCGSRLAGRGISRASSECSSSKYESSNFPQGTILSMVFSYLPTRLSTGPHSCPRHGAVVVDSTASSAGTGPHLGTCRWRRLSFLPIFRGECLRRDGTGIFQPGKDLIRFRARALALRGRVPREPLSCGEVPLENITSSERLSAPGGQNLPDFFEGAGADIGFRTCSMAQERRSPCESPA